jgi:hypothetical protein
MESRRHLNVRGKSATLPAITDKDWLDLKFGVESGVDAFALSFVKVSGAAGYTWFLWLLRAGQQTGSSCCCFHPCLHARAQDLSGTKLSRNQVLPPQTRTGWACSLGWSQGVDAFAHCCVQYVGGRSGRGGGGGGGNLAM